MDVTLLDHNVVIKYGLSNTEENITLTLTYCYVNK